MDMFRLYAIVGLILSSSAFAHSVQSITQHLKLNRQHESGWQQDILATASLSPKLDFGLQGTYVERFDLYEKRAGANIAYSLPNVTIQAGYLHGFDDTQILPHDQYMLSVYTALADGITPFVTYRNSLYSLTHAETFTIAAEIEKFANLIIIPRYMTGFARFDGESRHKSIYNYGLKLMYYKEGLFNVSLFGNKGTEISQGIIGSSSRTINTTSGGVGLGYYITSAVKAEYIFDYTDLGQLDNQFLTSTLNLVWTF